MTIALLTAAGVGSRMGQALPKQFLHIYDKPVLVYTLERFQRNSQIDAIAVVTLSNWVDFVIGNARQFGITKLRWVVPGGATGQDSIQKGLEAIARDCDSKETVIMIHDGNRPLVDDAVIADSLSVFRTNGSAVAVIPCAEVIFNSKSDKFGKSEIPREELWRTQTPHTFNLSKLLWACDQAKKMGWCGMAAMCQLMARLGETVYFSKGSEKNIKLTTMEDIDIFRALLALEKLTWQKNASGEE